VELPKVFLESSVISYLAARERSNRDIIATAHQQITREWWDRRRSRFEMYISIEVLNEIRRGDPRSAELRLAYVESLPVLEADDQARALAAEILRTAALPQKAAADAAHIAIATVNGMDFLVTWNCTHIANGIVQRAVSRISRAMGLEPPTIVTPEELMMET
jgi:hypothetical protein